MWPIHLTLFLFIVFRIFLSPPNLFNTLSFSTQSAQLIFSIRLQHHILKMSQFFIYFLKWPSFSAVQKNKWMKWYVSNLHLKILRQFVLNYTYSFISWFTKNKPRLQYRGLRLARELIDVNFVEFCKTGLYEQNREQKPSQWSHPQCSTTAPQPATSNITSKYTSYAVTRGLYSWRWA